MAFSGPAEDRLAIRELYDTIADAASRGDRAGWLGCYAPGARWASPYFDLAGMDAIAAKYDEIMGNVADTTFFTQVGSIEVDGDVARCRIFQSESLLFPNGSTYDLIGGYEDELVRHEGRWLFKDRVYSLKREKLPE